MRYLGITLILSLSTLIWTSCEKKEQPYPLPEPGTANFEKLDIGDAYEYHLFYSFQNGLIKTDSFEIWDLCFTQDLDAFEIWLNGGKGNLIYKTTSTDFSETPANIPNAFWKYDEPTWIKNKSAYGLIHTEDLDFIWLLKTNQHTYKFKILSINDENNILIQIGRLNDSEGTIHQLTRNSSTNYLYLSAKNGLVNVEPPKENWDVLFTRYRHIFYGVNPDGSDLPYYVNGVLLNPYQTLGAADTLTPRVFDDLELEEALEAYELTSQRDIIGYHWKEVNINNAEYTVLPERVYLVKDQESRLWKIHFVNFYSNNGQKGKPQFEFQRLN